MIVINKRDLIKSINECKPIKQEDLKEIKQEDLKKGVKNDVN